MSNITTTNATNAKDIAFILRLLRQEAELSLRDVAKQTGVSYYRLSRLERNKDGARLTLDELCRLAATYGSKVRVDVGGSQA